VIHQRQKFIARLFARAERAQRVDSLLNHLRHLLRQAFLTCSRLANASTEKTLSRWRLQLESSRPMMIDGMEYLGLDQVRERVTACRAEFEAFLGGESARWKA